MSDKQTKAKRFFTLKSMMSKIVLSIIVVAILLLGGVAGLGWNSMRTLESELVTELEIICTEYMGDFLAEGEWSIRDNCLYKGELLIGDATEEKANIQPFVELEEKTGTFFYTFMKTEYLAPDVKAAIDAASDHFTSYARVAGSTRDANGNSIVGTYIDNAVDEVLNSEGVYSGRANVQGRPIFCHYEVFKDADGNVIGCTVTGRSIEEVEGQIMDKTVRAMLFIAAMVALVTLGLVIIFRLMTKNIGKINERLDIIGTGEFPNEPLVLNSKDELDDIASSINEMTKSLKEKERIGAELELATDIQKNLLPRIFPAFPEHDEFDIYASMDPAKEVGGDFYDMFLLDDETLGVVIGDVSGKGVPAALFMVIAKTLIKNYAQSGLSPAETYTKVNHILCENNEQNLFVTSWMAYINLKDGTMTYVNAGHNPPLVMRDGGDYEYMRGRTGFVLAGLDAVRYKQCVTEFKPGDKLLLYTDGVTEAVDKDENQYGEQRLLDFINCRKKESAEICIKGISNDIREFAGDAEQFDDITMLMLEFCKKSQNDEGVTEREFVATDSSLESVLAFAEEELDKAGCPMKSVMQINVAIEEIFVNIAHYAYGKQIGKMRLAFKNNDGMLMIRFSDRGMPFNPLSKTDPDITLSAEERKIGGLGIFIVKKTMDDVQYEYKSGKNVLTLTKNIKD